MGLFIREKLYFIDLISSKAIIELKSQIEWITAFYI